MASWRPPRGAGDWPAALGNEYVGVFGVIASQLTQSPHLVTADWMHTGDSVLDTVNVQAALGQFDLRPLQVAHLGGAQAMAVGHQDHGRIAMAVPAMLAGAVHIPMEKLPARPPEDRPRDRTEGAKAACEGRGHLEGGEVARDRDWHGATHRKGGWLKGVSSSTGR